MSRQAAFTPERPDEQEGRACRVHWAGAAGLVPYFLVSLVGLLSLR